MARTGRPKPAEMRRRLIVTLPVSLLDVICANAARDDRAVTREVERLLRKALAPQQPQSQLSPLV
jgi:hypothetical protein